MSETADYGEDVSAGNVGGVFKKITKQGTGSKSPQTGSEVMNSIELCDVKSKHIHDSSFPGYCALRGHAP